MSSNAASVGAKTVNGPSLLSVSAKPAAITAVSNVVWFSEATTISTIVSVSYTHLTLPTIYSV